MSQEKITTAELVERLLVRDSTVRTLERCLAEAKDARTKLDNQLADKTYSFFAELTNILHRTDLFITDDDLEEETFLQTLIRSFRTVVSLESVSPRLKLTDEGAKWLKENDIGSVLVAKGLPIALEVVCEFNSYLVIRRKT